MIFLYSVSIMVLYCSVIRIKYRSNTMIVIQPRYTIGTTRQEDLAVARALQGQDRYDSSSINLPRCAENDISCDYRHPGETSISSNGY